MDVAPPVISKIKTRKMPVGPTFLIRLHDLTGMPINELRRQMGVDQEPAGVRPGSVGARFYR